jgi:hypothetical protein
VVDYLERYRDHHALQPHYGQRVSRPGRRDGAWIAMAALDVGTLDHIRAGRIGVHGDIARFTAHGVE